MVFGVCCVEWFLLVAFGVFVVLILVVGCFFLLHGVLVVGEMVLFFFGVKVVLWVYGLGWWDFGVGCSLFVLVGVGLVGVVGVLLFGYFALLCMLLVVVLFVVGFWGVWCRARTRWLWLCCFIVVRSLVMWFMMLGAV